MKKLLFAGLALVAVSAFVGDVQAQSTGTVQVIGQVNSVGALRWWDWTPENTESGVNTPGVQNDPLDFVLTVGDVAAGNNLNDFAGGAVQLILRSNTTYSLAAEVTSSSSLAGSIANGDMVLADIGMGLSSLASSGDGSRVMAHASTIQNSFGNDPTSAALGVDGDPTFTTSLGDLDAGAVTVLSGGRISRRGGRNSPNNGLLVDVSFAVAPQYYTPTNSFSADVEFTMTAP